MKTIIKLLILCGFAASATAQTAIDLSQIRTPANNGLFYVDADGKLGIVRLGDGLFIENGEVRASSTTFVNKFHTFTTQEVGLRVAVFDTAPEPAGMRVYRNGLKQRVGVDFNLIGNSVLFTNTVQAFSTVDIEYLRTAPCRQATVAPQTVVFFASATPTNPCVFGTRTITGPQTVTLRQDVTPTPSQAFMTARVDEATGVLVLYHNMTPTDIIQISPDNNWVMTTVNENNPALYNLGYFLVNVGQFVLP